MARISQEREQKILHILQQERYCSILDLMNRLGTSRSTVRRTLETLAEQGLARMVHGGATIAGFSPLADESAARPGGAGMLEAKQRIAQAAAALIQPGDMLLIDAGSTTHELVPYLRAIDGLTILTNDIHIAHELVDGPSGQVILTGGSMGTGHRYCLVGRVAEQTIGQFVANRCIIGTSGIDTVRGITDPFPEVALVKAAMIRQSTEVILVADHTKLGRIHKAWVAPVDAVHRIITDKDASPEQLEQLQAVHAAVTLC